MKNKTLVVIGGGAAGFFCAVNAARLHPGLKVILLEKHNKLLSKVKVSGGGRCNVTHDCLSISELIKFYPRGSAFLKKAFHHFHTKDTIQWFEERDVSLKVESDGRMFPTTNDSQTIIDCLLNEANQYGVEILMNAEVESIKTETDKPFFMQLKNGKIINPDFICVACGGFPKREQFEWLLNLGHTIENPVPSLFTFNMPGNKIVDLMGITVQDAKVKINNTKLEQRGPLLITHWGFSGPSTLKLSAWGARVLADMKYEFSITVNWIPEYNENSLREKYQQLRFEIATQKIVNRNPFGLPSRLWEYFLNEAGIDQEIRWADLPAKEQNKLIKILTGQEFKIKGKTTFKEEFVTAGGIHLNEVDPNSMQSKILKGLYFAGEILDIDGVTGGFNFQNAWTTGYIASKLEYKNQNVNSIQNL